MALVGNFLITIGEDGVMNLYDFNLNFELIQ